MKKITLSLLMAISTLGASAQVNYTVQTACHPQDVKHYDTERLRSAFLMEKVMAPDEINLTYTLYDRLIYGKGSCGGDRAVLLYQYRRGSGDRGALGHGRRF